MTLCPSYPFFPASPHLFSALPTMSLINEYRVAKMDGGGTRTIPLSEDASFQPNMQKAKKLSLFIHILFFTPLRWHLSDQ
jgi:hypothetical protein